MTDLETQATQPVFADINGKHYNIPGAVPVPPGGSGAPTIPSNAGVKMLDDSTNWKGEHDSATGGSSTGLTKYLGSDKGRLFHSDFQNNAGFRWHNSYAKDTTPNHFCYKLGVSINRPDLLGCLELDINHVPVADQVYYLCIQATSWNNCWEYTTTPSGKCHWNKSSLKVEPQKWPSNTMQQIALYSHRDDKGNVFYDGVEFNGVYTPFDSTCHGLSMLKQNWGVGTVLCNFQLGGRGSGTLEATALNLQQYYWKA